VTADKVVVPPGVGLRETILRPFRSSFVEYGREHPNAVCLSADLTSSCEADGFKEVFPDRFYSMGMTEQSLMGVAGGMAREGMVPFVTTFSVFVTRRPYDQVAMAIAYPDLRVRLIGFLPGITTPGGVTHQAIDDVNLMRGLPNMTVLDLGDATEVETVWPVLDQIDGPVFCRVLRGEVPRLFDQPLELGVTRVLSDGDDITLVTSGIATHLTRAAVPLLARWGVGVRHLHVATLKPFGDEVLETALGSARFGVVTCENHSVIGGLGSAVCELSASRGFGRTVVRLGIQDRFTHGGSATYLAHYYGIDAMAVVRAVEQLTGRTALLSDQALVDALEAARTELDAAVVPSAEIQHLGDGAPATAAVNVEAL